MKILIIFSLLITSLNVLSHSGRTDSSGCHHNRKTGGYHCHKSKDTSVKPSQTREIASKKTEKLNEKKVVLENPSKE